MPTATNTLRKTRLSSRNGKLEIFKKNSSFINDEFFYLSILDHPEPGDGKFVRDELKRFQIVRDAFKACII